MNFISINVRGIGVEGKTGWVRRLKEANGISFMAIQEMQCGNIGRYDYSRLWGREDVETVVVEPSGRSGGLVNLWNPKVFIKEAELLDKKNLLTSGRLVEDGLLLNILNVYAPQNVVEKRVLWEKIKGVMRDRQGWWVLLGDFNVVRYPEERKNSRFNNVSAGDFNSFINEMCLREYVMRGNKFTFLAGKGKGFKMSKIDRVLVCQNFLDKWPEACLRALPRELSDHCPLVLTVVNRNYGAKPFRWFNSWIERDGCRELVNITLESCVFVGAPDEVLSKKFKHLRAVLKKLVGGDHEKRKRGDGGVERRH